MLLLLTPPCISAVLGRNSTTSRHGCRSDAIDAQGGVVRIVAVADFLVLAGMELTTAANGQLAIWWSQSVRHRLVDFQDIRVNGTVGRTKFYGPDLTTILTLQQRHSIMIVQRPQDAKPTSLLHRKGTAR